MISLGKLNLGWVFLVIICLLFIQGIDIFNMHIAGEYDRFFLIKNDTTPTIWKKLTGEL